VRSEEEEKERERKRKGTIEIARTELRVCADLQKWANTLNDGADSNK